jgi:hypothetical protein
MTTDQASPNVWRITIDEQLEDDLIRAVRCRLADGVDAFWDRTNEWAREYALLLTPEDYAQKLRLPPAQDETLPWSALQEGQVFLVGEFEAVRGAGAAQGEAPAHFQVVRGQSSFLRIDQMDVFRDGLKAVYATALRGGR